MPGCMPLQFFARRFCMTERKRKGIGFIVTGVVTAVVGVILVTLTQTPEWVGVALSIITAICNVIGIAFVAPDPNKV